MANSIPPGNRRSSRGGPRIDLTGQRYGRWIVLGPAPTRFSSGGFPSTSWRCRCDCGNEKEVRTQALRAGKSTSCGCWAAESWNTPRTHGYGSKRGPKNPTYKTWQGMLHRCYSPAAGETCIRYYQERGIKVCDRWRESFLNFLEDMGERPGPEYSIDRYPDNDGDYEPGNCRWATAEEQASNTRANLWIELNGRRMTASQWARELGIPFEMIRDRFHAGLSPEKILEPLPAESICPVCGTVFPTKPPQIYCKPRCCKRAWALRQQEATRPGTLDLDF